MVFNPIERRIKVLRYHRIVGEHDRECDHWSCLDVQEFRRHLHLLERWKYTPITFEDYRLSVRGDLDLPAKPVILTFDLAYHDNYAFMFPVMQMYGGKGVVFTAGDRNARESLWMAGAGIPVARLMSDQELVEMHAAGFEIGSHGMTYSNLLLMSSESASEEISRARMALEIVLNAPVLSFAYPFGAVNPETKRLVADAGYTIGCTMDEGPRYFGADLFEVRRVSFMKRANAAVLRAKLSLL